MAQHASLNLKQVAARFGVHYQTAYRWVRSGELHAVKLDGQYRVTQSSIERFEAERAERLERVDHAAGTHLEAGRDDAELDELRVAARATRSTAQPTLDLAARIAATALTDACLLRLVSEDGTRLELRAVDAVDPGLLAAIAGAERAVDLPVGTSPWDEAMMTGRVVKQDHVHQDKFDAKLGGLGRLLVGPYRPYSLAIAPIGEGPGAFGGLFVGRASPGRPFAARDLAFMAEIGLLCAEALRCEQAFHDAWKRSADLTAALEDMVSRSPSHSVDDLRSLLDDSHAEAVLDATGAQLVATDRMGQLLQEVPRSAAGASREPAEIIREAIAQIVDAHRDVVDGQLFEESSSTRQVVFLAAVRSGVGDLRFIALVVRGPSPAR